eukprot:COSAG02_NODE_9486_length_2202_cov_1.216833_1_plen_106_part_00
MTRVKSFSKIFDHCTSPVTYTDKNADRYVIRDRCYFRRPRSARACWTVAAGSHVTSSGASSPSCATSATVSPAESNSREYGYCMTNYAVSEVTGHEIQDAIVNHI